MSDKGLLLGLDTGWSDQLESEFQQWRLGSSPQLNTNFTLSLNTDLYLPPGAITDHGHSYHGIFGDYGTLCCQHINLQALLRGQGGLLLAPRSDEQPVIKIRGLRFYDLDGILPGPMGEADAVYFDGEGQPMLSLVGLPDEPLTRFFTPLGVPSVPEATRLLDLFRGAQHLANNPPPPHPDLTLKLPLVDALFKLLRDKTSAMLEVELQGPFAKLPAPEGGGAPVLHLGDQPTTLKVEAKFQNRDRLDSTPSARLSIYANADEISTRFKTRLPHVLIKWPDLRAEQLDWRDPHWQQGLQEAGCPLTEGYIWERLHRDGFLTKGGDLLVEATESEPEIRVYQGTGAPFHRGDHSQIELTLSGGIQIKALRDDRENWAQLPITLQDGRFTLLADGNPFTPSLQKLWLHLASQGELSLDGDLILPELSLYGQRIPPFYLQRLGRTQLINNELKLNYKDGATNLISDVSGHFHVGNPVVGNQQWLGQALGSFTLKGNLMEGLKLDLGTDLQLGPPAQPTARAELTASARAKLGTEIKDQVFHADGTLSGELGLRAGTPGIGMEARAALTTFGNLSADLSRRTVDANLGARALLEGSFMSHLGYGDFLLDADSTFSVRGAFEDPSIASLIQFNAQLTADGAGGSADLIAQGSLSVIKESQLESTSGAMPTLTVALNTQQFWSNLIFPGGVAIAGHAVDGLKRDGILGGLRMAIEMQGVEPGRFAEGTANMALTDLVIQFKNPLNGQSERYQLSGQLVGRFTLINVSDDPKNPRYLPLAQSLDCKIHDARVLDLNTKRPVVTSGLIKIRDEGGGRIVFQGEQKLTLPMWQLPLSEKFEITIDPRAIRVYPPEAATSLAPPSEQGSCEPSYTYYDLPLINDLSLKLNAQLGTILARAEARIKDLQGSQPTATYDGRIDFGGHRIPLPDKRGSIGIKGGGLSVKGDLKALEAGLELPKTIQYHLKQPLPDNHQLEINGVLHPRVTIPAHLNFQTKRAQLGKNRRLRLLGALTAIIKDPSGRILHTIPLKINVPVQFDVEARIVDAQSARIDFQVPELAVEAILTDDVRIEQKALGEVLLSKGSVMKLPLTGLSGSVDVSVNNGQLKVKQLINPPQLGLALELVGSPLEKLALLPLPGALQIGFNHDFNGQQLALHADGHGLTARAVEPTKAATTKLTLTIGPNIDVAIELATKNAQFKGHFDLGTGMLHTEAMDLTVSAQARGHVQLADKTIDLNNIAVEASVLTLQTMMDTRTKHTHVKITVPSGHPAIEPPASFTDWMAWTANDWQTYHNDMNAKPHFMVISEQAAGLPGLDMIPKGRGKIYIDLRDNTLSLNLNDPVALAALQDQIIIRREFPNPPAAAPHQIFEGMIYNPGQDALFMLDINDTKLIERLQQAFGLSENSARTLFRNGRLDLDQIVQIPWVKNHLGEETFRNLAQYYFSENLSPTVFTKKAHRFLLIIADLRENLSNLVSFNEMYWSKQVRKTIPRDFSDEDTAAFRGNAPKDGDGVNITAYSYLPSRYDLDSIEAHLGSPQSYADWWPGLGGIELETGNQIRGQFTGGHTFAGQFSQRTVGNVRGYALTNDHPKNEKGAMEVFANEYILIPIRDEAGISRGSILVQQYAADFNGNDGAYYKGKHLDLSKAGRHDAIIWEDGIPLLSHKGRKILNPVREPISVAPSLLAQSVSNLNHLLHGGEDYDKDTASLTYVPSGLIMTSEPKEFMLMPTVDTASDQPFALTLKPETGDEPRVIKIITSSLDVSEEKAAEWIRGGQISLDDLMEIDFIKQNLDPETIKALAEVFFNQLFEGFQSRGERFFLFLKDIRLHIKDWANQASFGHHVMNFRNFSESRFHRWSPHNNKDPGDGTDNIAITVVPNNVSIDALANTLGHPETFTELTSDYAESRRAPCTPTQPNRYCADLTLMVASKPAQARIEVPEEAVKIGPVRYTPWWYTVRPDVPTHDQGFDENVGGWVFVPTKLGTIICRISLLNTKFSGDAELAGVAAGNVAKFLENTYHHAGKTEGKDESVDIEYEGMIE